MPRATFVRQPLLSAVFLLAACAPADPPPLVAHAVPPGAQVQRVYVATQHGDLTRLRSFGNARQWATRFFAAEVSIPPSHRPGQIEVARRQVDPMKHFALTGAKEFSRGQFLATLDEVAQDTGGIGIFVHGYNTNLIDAGLRVAQIQADFDMPFPLVAFAWPSSGEARGYIYDRDSVLFARDGLAQLIGDIHRRTGRRVTLVAHSMGSLLTMEALRQLELTQPGRVRGLVDTVFLISPDIDPDVFGGQVAAIGRLPQPFVVVSAQQDRVLKISSFITGTRARLGEVQRSAALEAQGVTFVDVTQLGGSDPLGHSIPFSAPGQMQALLMGLDPRR